MFIVASGYLETRRCRFRVEYNIPDCSIRVNKYDIYLKLPKLKAESTKAETQIYKTFFVYGALCCILFYNMLLVYLVLKLPMVSNCVVAYAKRPKFRRSK